MDASIKMILVAGKGSVTTHYMPVFENHKPTAKLIEKAVGDRAKDGNGRGNLAHIKYS